ncbi:MAG: hypothetical protein Q4B57_04195 [Eubacteriales bacterium]|nr:hypothetical protein [Eubacteriales bacterium]
MDAIMESQEQAVTMPSILELYIPKWVEMLPADHPVKAELVGALRLMLQSMGDGEGISAAPIEAVEFVQKVSFEQRAKETDGNIVRLRIDIEDAKYYEMLSGLAGVEIEGEYQLIAMIRELSAKKKEYEKAQQALQDVQRTGYGVITPVQEEIRMEAPALVRQGNKFGVKLRASSPSIHLIRADIETEIAPIIGSEEQAQDLIAYIKSASGSEKGIWETNIFGKSIEQLTEDEIRTKLAKIGGDTQQKLQRVMQRIVNETSGGLICIIL